MLAQRLLFIKTVSLGKYCSQSQSTAFPGLSFSRWRRWFLFYCRLYVSFGIESDSTEDHLGGEKPVYHRPCLVVVFMPTGAGTRGNTTANDVTPDRWRFLESLSGFSRGPTLAASYVAITEANRRFRRNVGSGLNYSQSSHGTSAMTSGLWADTQPSLM